MEILGFLLHLDQYLVNIINWFGNWTYVLMFFVVFAETGLVVTPFLPGDSLLFAVGALAGIELLNIYIVYLALLAAAIMGDSLNYGIGRYLGPRIFNKKESKFLNQGHLDKTSHFFEKYGAKTIVIARFVPIVRTFAPFVAGIGSMRYSSFIVYNIVGGFVWVTSLTMAGYFFGGMPIVKENFEYVILGIIGLSLLPILVEYIKHKIRPDHKEAKINQINYDDIRKTFGK